MRFNTSRGNSRNDDRNDGDEWKARGFLNISLPSKHTPSGWRKLGKGIPLSDSVVVEKELCDLIEKNPEAVCAALAGTIKIEYRSATPQAGKGFDLEALAAAAEGKTGTNG